ncbi:MAG: thioredoxin domain-containing protein [Candidatus Sumerlaeaceae bacterium]
MPVVTKWILRASTAACVLMSTTLFAQDPQVADHLRALTNSVDRLTSTNLEIMRRLERIETKTQQVLGMRQTVDANTSTQIAVLQQLHALQTSVAGVGKPTPAPVATPAGPKLPIPMELGPGRMQGDADTTVVLVMFTDAQCGYCSRFLAETFPTLKTDYIDNKKIRFAIRDLNLASHKDANKAAMAARCAEEQGKYWEMVFSIYKNRGDITTATLVQQAKVQQLDVEQFAACFESEKYINDAKVDMAKASTLGFAGTPSFAIGYSRPGSSQITVTKVIRGARPLIQFRTALDQMFLEPLPAQ